MEVGPRIFALRPQDRDIIDLLVSPDAQACCLNAGRTIYFAHPMPIAVLELLTSEELSQLHQHLDGNANLYSLPVSEDWCDVRSRIISHLSDRGYSLPRRLLLTFTRHFQHPGKMHSKWNIPVLKFVRGGMEGPAPYDITDSHSGRIDVGMELPSGKRISSDPRKDTLRGAIEKANGVGELNKYLDAMRWGVPIPVYNKGRHGFRDGGIVRGETREEVVVWYRWVEDPSSIFGGRFVPLVRNIGAGVDVGRSMYKEGRFLKALDEARRFFLDSDDRVLEGRGLERVDRVGGTRQHRQHSGRHHAGSSNYPEHGALPSRPVREDSVSGPECPWTKKSERLQKISMSSDSRHLGAFHRSQREAMELSTRLNRDVNLPPPVHAQNPHSYVINGKRYTKFRNYDPRIHNLTIEKNISDFLTKDALDRCEMIYKNFGTEHEIEEMALLYDLPPHVPADVMEIPVSLLDYIANLRQDTTRYILSGRILLHWEFSWCPVPALAMPLEQLSTRIRHVVNYRRESGAVGLDDYETPEIHRDSSLEQDVPESLISMHKPGSTRPAHQSHESHVQTTAGPSICGMTQIAISKDAPHAVQNHSIDEEPSHTHTEEESHGIEAKVQCTSDQQQNVPAKEANLEDTKKQVYELHAGTPQPAGKDTEPTVIHDPAADSKKHSRSDNGKDEVDAPSRVVPQPATVESPSASEMGEDDNLVSEGIRNSGSAHLSRSNSDQEWSWLNGGYES